MSTDPPLDARFLGWVKAHTPGEGVRRQAEAAGLNLEALKTTEPLTYATINSVPLIRTNLQLVPQAGEVIASLLPHHQLFNVPLKLQQTDAELRVFPPPEKRELELLDNAFGQFAGTQQGYLFYRTVGDRGGERRELAWPLEPEVWQGGAALVGPFNDEGAAAAWGKAHADPRTGFVYDTLSYAGAWFCDVFKGEL